MDPLFNLFWYLFGVSFLKKKNNESFNYFYRNYFKMRMRERERKKDRQRCRLTFQKKYYTNGNSSTVKV